VAQRRDGCRCQLQDAKGGSMRRLLALLTTMVALAGCSPSAAPLASSTSSAAGSGTSGGVTSGNETSGSGTSSGGPSTSGTSTGGGCASCTANEYCNDGQQCSPKQADGAVCVDGFGWSCLGLCLVPAGERTGRCCHAACNLSDAICGATACDSAGACVYPDAGSACGTSSCNGGVLTFYGCDGSGTCTTSSQPCPGSAACSSPTSC
jgi:hypothetical protein